MTSFYFGDDRLQSYDIEVNDILAFYSRDIYADDRYIGTVNWTVSAKVSCTAWEPIPDDEYWEADDYRFKYEISNIFASNIIFDLMSEDYRAELETLLATSPEVFGIDHGFDGDFYEIFDDEYIEVCNDYFRNRDYFDYLYNS